MDYKYRYVCDVCGDVINQSITPDNEYSVNMANCENWNGCAGRYILQKRENNNGNI